VPLEKERSAFVVIKKSLKTCARERRMVVVALGEAEKGKSPTWLGRRNATGFSINSFAWGGKKRGLTTRSEVLIL